METEIVTALIAAAAAFLGALVGHWFSMRQLHQEQVELTRSLVHQKILEAYQKLWAALGPASYYDPSSKGIIIRNNDGIYLNQPAAERLFSAMSELFYSEHGMFLSKRMRTAIYTVRDFVLEVMAKEEQVENGLQKISNNKAKRIENGLDWIRKNARRDVGLNDAHFPADELGVSNPE